MRTDFEKLLKEFQTKTGSGTLKAANDVAVKIFTLLYNMDHSCGGGSCKTVSEPETISSPILAIKNEAVAKTVVKTTKPKAVAKATVKSTPKKVAAAKK